MIERGKSFRFEVAKPINHLVSIIVFDLPEFAMDNRFKVEKTKNGWIFIFRPNFDKTWHDEVEINLLLIENDITRFVVNSHKVEFGILKGNRTELPKTAKNWAEKFETMYA